MAGFRLEVVDDTIHFILADPFAGIAPRFSNGFWLFHSNGTVTCAAICDFLRREDELMTELMNHKRSTS
jgi:hypothetical protein